MVDSQEKQENLLIHPSVLVAEVLEYLNPQPGKLYVDVTFGSGGHTRAILDAQPKCKVIAFDWDKKTIDTYASSLEEEYKGRLKVIWGNFAQIIYLLKKEKITCIDGVLADFGTSYMHIFEREGFSFMRDTDLDMRMSPAHQSMTAARILNESTEQALVSIFFDYGQERHSRRIASMVVKERAKNKFKTTLQLAKLIEKCVPRGKSKIHPATRVFQALRIYVNRELDNIHSFLIGALRVLKHDGRLICISFHSLEDRMVKHFYKEQEQLGHVFLLHKKAIIASDEEIELNPSSRSARLRALQIIKNKKEF
jgi:16S rRNA (cytosine1402-N4)-methyltransferase